MLDWFTSILCVLRKKHRAIKRVKRIEALRRKCLSHADLQKEQNKIIQQRCDNLKKFKVAVYIRAKDGGRCYFESEVIGFLASRGVSITHYREDELKKVASGTEHIKDLLVISGTFFLKDEQEHCDFRVLHSVDGEVTEIKSAGFLRGDSVCGLPLAVVMHAAKFLDS